MGIPFVDKGFTRYNLEKENEFCTETTRFWGTESSSFADLNLLNPSKYSTTKPPYFCQKDSFTFLSRSCFLGAIKKKEISFLEFGLEMAKGIYRGLFKIASDVHENYGIAFGLVSAVGIIAWKVPKPYSSIILGGILLLGTGVSSKYLIQGIWNGTKAFRENDQQSLIQASTDFGVGVWGLGFTYLGWRIGKQLEGKENLGAVVGFLLHSGDEIIAMVTIGNHFKKLKTITHFG